PEADRLLEGVALDVTDEGPVIVDQGQEPSGRSPWRHRVIHLPVLVAHRGGRRAREVEEDITRRVLRRAFEIGELIEAVEPGLDDAGVLAGLDLLVQVVALGTAGDINKRGQPVEGGKHFFFDRARLDVTRPADDTWRAIAAFPRLALLTLEGGDASIRETNRLCAVIRGEDDDGVVQLAHLFQLRQHQSDVVVQLLHAGFVDAPILAPRRAHHGQVLVRQHGGDVHARRVVPDEEGFVGLLGVIAIEEVNDLAGDFLVHGLRPLQCQRAFVLARLVLLRAVGGVTPDDRPRRRQAGCGSGIHCAGRIREARYRRVLARRSDALYRRAVVDV